MESTQLKEMVQRVRRVGNFARAALLLGTRFLGGEGMKITTGKASHLQSCQLQACHAQSCFRNISADSHAQGSVCPVLHCLRSARVREREGVESFTAALARQGRASVDTENIVQLPAMEAGAGRTGEPAERLLRKIRRVRPHMT